MLYARYASMRINKRLTRHEPVEFTPGMRPDGPTHANLKHSREGQLCSFFRALEAKGEHRGDYWERGEEQGGIWRQAC